MTAADVTTVLLWAAGSDRAPSDDARPDELDLLALVDMHALTARLVHRLESTAPSWATDRLRRGLAGLDDANRRKAEAHTAAAAEITAIEAVGNPVLVKGVSTNLATGLAYTLRCGDIDMVVPDAAAATDVVLGLGYERTREPFMHEVGEFTRGTTEIDLHAYFPVHSYTGMDPDILDAAAHPGVWVQPGFRLSMRPISWAMLDAYRVDRAVAGGRVSVPGADLLAIILSAHGFMNFTNVWSISHREKPYVRLGELADLRDLVADARFCPDRFARLVHDLDATDAVEWASWAYETLIGPSPLPRTTRATYPRCLWWGWWANLPLATGSWLRPDWYDMAQVTRDLGANLVPLTGGQSALLRLDDAGALPRQLRLTQNAALGPVALRFSDGGSTVIVVLPERPAAHIERVRVDFGSVASECRLTGERPDWSATGSHLEADLATVDGHRELTLRFCDKVGGHVLVGLADEDAEGRHPAGVLVPVALYNVGSEVDSLPL